MLEGQDLVQPDPIPSGRLPRWFCLATNYGQAAIAETAIRALKWRIYFPECLDRRSGRVSPLWPGYGLVEFDAQTDDWSQICRARGVYRLLGRVGRPEPLPIGVVEGLIARTSARNIVDDPGEGAEIVQFRPKERARIVSGALAGFEGVCALSSRGRIALLMSLFGRETTVHCAPHELERA